MHFLPHLLQPTLLAIPGFQASDWSFIEPAHCKMARSQLSLNRLDFEVLTDEPLDIVLANSFETLLKSSMMRSAHCGTADIVSPRPVSSDL